MTDRLDVPRYRISVLHASFRAGDAALRVRDEWLRNADHPDLVEYVFSFDADDEISVATLVGLANPPMPGRVTAVRNWLAAAKACTGTILVTGADDLRPPAHWDSEIVAALRSLDPLRAPVVVKLKDSVGHLIQHPVVTRAYYERYGLFHPMYDGIGCDPDFTYRAHGRGLVIDARHIVLQHGTPGNDTESKRKMHDPVNSTPGRLLYEKTWPLWKRRLLKRYLVPRQGQVTISRARIASRSVIARLGWLAVLVPRWVLHLMKPHLSARSDRFD